MSPSAACDQPVEDPAIGIAVTSAKPTSTTAASSGLCQACSAGTIAARKSNGTIRLAARPATTTPGRRAMRPTRDALIRMPALKSSTASSSLGSDAVHRPPASVRSTISVFLIQSPAAGNVAASA